jgi:FkbM family methyltransferase
MFFLNFLINCIPGLNNFLTDFFLSRKLFIKNKKVRNKEILFSVRNFGRITFVRASKFYELEPETIEWIDGFKTNSLLLDIGANIGMYSLYAATQKHQVISLEPNSLNFAHLNLNISDNNLNKLIKAFPLCAHQEKKISYLYHSKILKFGGAHSTFDRNIIDTGQPFESKFVSGSYSISVDDLSSELQKYPNYIKIDVDGNELNVIQGMKKILQNEHLLSILVEINPEFEEHKKCLEIISKNFFLKNRYCSDNQKKVYNYIFIRKQV